ncbi:hypothetical protein [Paraburkholderia sediminicola]|uniref:hypothetical protein n=1 Tax=Paraburkholderia sediminicola TaxID=458836 RepID=UPI0038BBEDFB
MVERIPVDDGDIVQEFRLRRVAGSTVQALTNPALRICLTNCAELRKKQRQADQPTPDGKRFASGDTD